MDPALKIKYTRLLDYIKQFDRVGVACSGGVDSTLLAYACCEALGADRVVICFAESCLLTDDVKSNISQIISRELPTNATFVKINIDSLADEDFIRNDENRCYICKKRIYTALLSHLNQYGIEQLCDGTNCDDLVKDRPGLKAIDELNVITPLVEAGFRKKDVRKTAAGLGLANAYLPSNSCLATRIESHRNITDRVLREIESHERFLTKRGFAGCRVRPRENMVIIEVQSRDLNTLVKPEERNAINSYFQRNGYKSVVIELSGRSD